MTVAQIDEIPQLVRDHGITSFKYYMFYKGFDLASNSRDSRSFTMGDEYDLGHLFLIMEKLNETQAEFPHLRLSLSLHCEQSELMRVFIDRVKANGDPQTLKAYHDGRPPLTERVAIGEATTIASHTGTNINLLHLSSADAVAAAVQAREAYPWVDMRFETTLHHLCLDHDTLDAKGGLGGKVNPPIRTKADNEVLWQRLADGDISWVASDHACCMEELKGDKIWPAHAGLRRHRAALPGAASARATTSAASRCSASSRPSRPTRPPPTTWRARARCRWVPTPTSRSSTSTRRRPSPPSCASRGRTTARSRGVDLTGWPVHTVVGGQVRFRDGEVVGEPTGRFIARNA